MEDGSVHRDNRVKHWNNKLGELTVQCKFTAVTELESQNNVWKRTFPTLSTCGSHQCATGKGVLVLGIACNSQYADVASGYPLDQLSTGLLRSFVVELESHRTANALASAYFRTWGNHTGHKGGFQVTTEYTPYQNIILQLYQALHL